MIDYSGRDSLSKGAKGTTKIRQKRESLKGRGKEEGNQT